MNQPRRFSIVSELVDALKAAGSWSGETHVQKSMYFLEELFPVEAGYGFVLYRHGPFSFDLRDDLSVMRGDGLLELHSFPPYGPSIASTPASAKLRSHFPKTLANASRGIAFVANHLGSKNVNQLERLATALYVLREQGNDTDNLAVAARLTEVKPHVSTEQAKEAIGTVRRMIAESLK